MWFGLKREVAPLYKDETMRRAFATASGSRRPKGVDKLKKMKLGGEKQAEPKRKGLFARFM